MEFADRVVVVTGGGSGIGEALARHAVTVGARHVVVADIHGDQASRVADEIGGTAVELDVREESGLRHLVEETEARHGPIGLFCSNAGILGSGGVEEPNDRLQMLWDVHVMSHIYAARAVLPSMIAQGEGYLLNTASAAGMLAQIGSMGYTVTKAADIALSEWLAITHHHQGIRVSVLCPQAIRTNLAENSPVEVDLSGLESTVGSNDGVLEPGDAAAIRFDAMREERFLVLPNPEIAQYALRKATDVDRWLSGMRRLQDRMYAGGKLPGDVIARPSAT